MRDVAGGRGGGHRDATAAKAAEGAKCGQQVARKEHVRRQEQVLMVEVREKHREAPLQKQRSVRVREGMVTLSEELLRNTDGFKNVEASVVTGLAQMLTEGRSASTDEKYFNAFERVRRWAQRVGVPAMPMSTFDWMRYLWALFQHSQSNGLARGNIDMAAAAVERMH